MLERIRKGSNSFTIKIILTLIALSFVGGGAASFLHGNSRGNIVTFKNADPISMEEFQLAKSREINIIQRENGIHLTEEQVAELGIDGNVLNYLITNSMVKYLAQIYDFDLAEEKIISYIKENSDFKNESGEFDLNIFKSVFDNSLRKENEYISSIKDRMIYSSMARIFRDSFTPSSALNDNMIEYMAQAREIDVFLVDLDNVPNDYIPDEVTASQIQDFYKNNKSIFVVPELRSFDYIMIDKEYLQKKLDISESDLKAYFNENNQDFPNRDFSEAKSQIKEMLTQERTEELASELAKNLEEDSSNGLNITEIAEKYNIKIHSQEKISLSAMNSSKKPEYVEFADSVFELAEGEISYPIEMQDRSNILLVQIKSIQEPKQMELDEVTHEIGEILKREMLAFENKKNLESFRKSYDSTKIDNSVLKSKGIIKLSNQELIRSELSMQDQFPVDLLNTVFNLKKNDISQIVSDEKKLYFAHVKSVRVDKAKVQKIKKNSENYFSDIIRDGVFQELINHLTIKNKIQLLQNK
jgi:peptidyl-prolyl cis-trans isomerase D